jgi:hypothetical protein
MVLPTEAQAGDPLKPYVVLALDTSGSMGQATGSGPPSCGGTDTKLNHARCAITKIVASYGDIVFALSRFRTTMSGTTTASTFPAGCCATGPGGAQSSPPGCANGITCNATDDMFELLSPLVDGGNSAAGVWTNLSGNTCTAAGTDPEIWQANGNTPLAGTLAGAKDYWLGQQAAHFTIWPSTSPGFAPIANDPTNAAFLPAGCDPSPTCTTNCCAGQCRPYVVILLTDGAETCTGTPTTAAASLLSTVVSNKKYRVETKPIGFGIAPGDAQIEAIAHAGGAVDIPGVNEGFYAQDESGVELAMSSIIEGSIKTEVCNNLDDDCDGAIDEDFVGKGNACDNGLFGACKVAGTEVCRADGTGLICSAGAAACTGKPAGAACTVTNTAGQTVAGTCQNGDCVPTPGVEICNGIDDDCDGKIDEGLSCTCTPQPEICNGVDDDCDGKIDEGITRPCGVDVGVCHAGIETCVMGQFVNCTATTGTTEICDGLDNDCDGVVDGITLACSNMTNGFPAGDPRNNPNTGICHPGEKVCPVNSPPPHVFGPCLNEVTPRTEICNGIDDDCDGKIDEDTGGADCSSGCGVGKTVCVGGVLMCDSMPAIDDETCDGVDDDCDGKIDEDYVSVPCGAGQVCMGMTKCVNGQVVCDGNPISQETCNCNDDDCDGKVDEDAICPSGTECPPGICECVAHCNGGEFPCPTGKICVNTYCVTDPCFGVNCPPMNGNLQLCQNGTCVDACSVKNPPCQPPLICFGPTGECAPDDCSTFPDRCSADQNCVNGVCVSNPCNNVTCPSGQYCVAGQCYDSCAGVHCAMGERCELGKCVKDPCGMTCPAGQVCHDDTGMCVDDPCPGRICPTGQYCNPHDGQCEDDPCTGTACPDPSQVCIGGSCYLPGQDGGPEDHVTTGGGGGCSSGSAPAGLLVALAVLLVRRRRAS